MFFIYDQTQIQKNETDQNSNLSVEKLKESESTIEKTQSTPLNKTEGPSKEVEKTKIPLTNEVQDQQDTIKMDKDLSNEELK